MATQFRLVTRSDFDGLVCGVLLKELDLIDEITFVHPKDMQDGKIAISDRDITTNLPYVASCHLAFDHHSSEMRRNQRSEQRSPDRNSPESRSPESRSPESQPPETEWPKNHVIDPEAFSAARVVYEYFGGRECFPRISDDIMTAVDKADAAQFTREDILTPRGWAFLSFLMDSRTGLGRFRQFRISNYDLMMKLIDYCRDHSVDDILALPDVKERVELYLQHAPQFREQLLRCSRVHGDLVVLDLRDEEAIYAGNRFMIYALFPQCRVSMHVMWGAKRQNTVFAIGKSIIDRTSPVDIGALCLTYGGGGHAAAGTCQIENARAEAVMAELIGTLAAGR
jgi:nanoRNase/pAp phosphatase (c-di-AMP/oligoRNAs hydrolase)